MVNLQFIKKLNFKCYFQRLLNIICIKNCFKYSGYNNLNLNATAKKKKKKHNLN